MILTEEFERVISLIENTNDCIYVTGKAGCGKTTLLKHIQDVVYKQCVVVAPTGVAAINAGGTTIHKLFQLPLGVLTTSEVAKHGLNKASKQVLQALDLLIIDEVSMVRSDVMDAIDYRLRKARSIKEPFGGVQVVMFGDLYQLPPVVKSNEKELLASRYDKNFYFFNAEVFQEDAGFHVIELTKVFRQSDPQFIEILNGIRDYTITDDQLEDLAEIVDFTESKKVDDNALHIATHRRIVDEINSTQLGEAETTYEAEITGTFPSLSCDEELQLRVGARVMILVNDKMERYFNGTLGKVEQLKESSVVVMTDDGKLVELGTHQWVNYSYETSEKTDEDGNIKTVICKKEIGSCTQIPVTLAWAITVHKAQGLTFDNVVLHIKGTFAAGQLYVALSRCRSLQGIILDSYVTRRMIIKDKALKDFEKEQRRRGGKFGKI
ncbi:MAG: AAA family ATPase [Bacteroidaceae bacterium]|nr:AAA family ATPase [Bacteroidaceae bacterium]